ncbi:type III PLP-dependent enzyme [Streptomyces sp. SL13]|nr:type III PLP-dependent enzyme [Streptantibioticus silvisoli]MDI5970711.1 type III PLP-dependent enzyme [Streptantibioticus silvisoli]
MARIREFLDRVAPPTPCLVIDLQTVRDRYLELTEALPGARAFYAVKANPAPGVLRLLATLGAGFDVASIPEIELCLAEGARPEDISYGNTIKKRADVAKAFALGVRKFTTDSMADLENLAECAPGSSVFCRVALNDTGAVFEFGSKFGCASDMVVSLLARTGELGLHPAGVSFHVGSQQLDPAAWDAGIAEAAEIAAKLASDGIQLPLLNIGGGFPGNYTVVSPPTTHYATVISDSLARHFGAAGLPLPEVMLEPGRLLVADAGLLRTEVVLVSRKSTADDHRWVYLDSGRYNGMADTENDWIYFQLTTPRRGGETGPVILAGPTCDGTDVWYHNRMYELPLELRAGDHVDVLSAGAYSTSTSCADFNGFAPTTTHCV